jgi:hypothetical protein
MRPKLRIGAPLILVLLLITGCAQMSTSGKPKAADTTNPPPGAVATAGGCGSTQLYTGRIPGWAQDVETEDAKPGLTGSPPGPYAVSSPPTAVAFLGISYPLLSDQTKKTMRYGNKVLWAIQGVPKGELVAVDAYPSGSSSLSASVHYDLGPGAVSRLGAALASSLDVPTPGCWQFVLRWAGHSAELSLQYQ